MKRALLFLLLFVVAAVTVSSGTPRIKWYKDINDAFKKAAKESRPIFVDVYADWCTWCHKLDREVYTDPRFVKYMKSFVMLKVDSEDQGKGTAFAQKYEVEGLPLLLVLDSKGKAIDRISGFKHADQLMNAIYVVQNLLDKERKNPEDFNVVYDLANEYLKREMYEEAEIRFARIVAAPNVSKAKKEPAQFSNALALYSQGKLQPALAALNTYYNTYKDGSSNEDALLLLSQVHIELNSNDQAIKYLREFKQKYPRSGNAVRAQQVLSALEKDCANC
jgi:thioredoxin-related protein